MTSPPPSPPNGVPKNPWNRNSAVVAGASATTLAGEWPPLQASQIPAAEAQAELQAEAGAGAEANMSQPPATSAVDPVEAAAPYSSSAPPPPPSPVSTNHSRNHNPNQSNHRRVGRNQWRNHQHQGNFHHNRYPQWYNPNPNPIPNVSFDHFLPPQVWSPPLPPPQWASFPGPPMPFYPNGYIDGNPHHSVYNVVNPTAQSHFPTGPPLPFPPGQEMTQLMTKIRKQIEYYFSEGNLITDVYLKRQMDKEFGWVDLRLVAGFTMVDCRANDAKAFCAAKLIKGCLRQKGHGLFVWMVTSEWFEMDHIPVPTGSKGFKEFAWELNSS